MKLLTRLGGNVIRRSTQPIRSQTITSRASAARATQRLYAAPITSARSYHGSKPLMGIMPHAEDPAPKESEQNETPTVPTDIPTSEYNARADEFLEELVGRLESEQDKRSDLEVEYAAGVLEISTPDKGTYVLNKQPPNKQIWLSSPVSGPKRFDWVVSGEGMHQKEGGGTGDWIYLRDGTSLTELLKDELGVTLGVDHDAPS